MQILKTPRIKIPLEVRDYVFKRDRHQCQDCGEQSPAVKLQIDHVIPLAKGGSNDLSNLQTLCERCNFAKGDRTNPKFQRRYSS